MNKKGGKRWEYVSHPRLAFGVWVFSFLSLILSLNAVFLVLHQVFSKEYFADITTFLAFNVMAVIGNFATEIVRFPGKLGLLLMTKVSF